MGIIEKPIVKVLMLKGEKGEQGDVSLSQLTSETNARINADNNLQTQINSLAGGTPIVVSSTSDMTDTSKIYVNTTDGNWYYYNGSSWTIGGSYTSSSEEQEINEIKTALDEVITITPSCNIIDPTDVLDNNALKYTYNEATTLETSSSTIRNTYNKVITTVSGDIIYSNAPGRLVYYNSEGVCKGNQTFSLDSELGLYKATTSNVKTCIDCINSEMLNDYWFACKKDDYNGEVSQYGASTISSNNFAMKNDVNNLQNSVDEILDATTNNNYFIPTNIYGLKNRISRKRQLPIENMAIGRNLADCYLVGNTYSKYTNISNNNCISLDTTGQNSPITIKDRRNDEVLYQKGGMYFNTVSSDTVVNPSSEKNVLIIGDSFTDNGYMPCEVKNILVNDLNLTNINFVGHKTETIDGITCKTCGIGGIAVKDYIKTDNSEGRGTSYPNPFLYDGSISFTQYMSDYAEGKSLDIVVIECGINDLITLTGWNASQVVNNVQTLINNIHSEYPNCKIFLVGQKYASEYQTTINTFAVNVPIMNLNKGYNDLCLNNSYSSFCTYVDIALLYDTLNYQPYEEQILYKGSNETVKVITDWLHPSAVGYYAIAENIAGAIAYTQFLSQ